VWGDKPEEGERHYDSRLIRRADRPWP
jgi:hypothetical protein